MKYLLPILLIFGGGIILFSCVEIVDEGQVHHEVTHSKTDELIINTIHSDGMSQRIVLDYTSPSTVDQTELITNISRIVAKHHSSKASQIPLDIIILFNQMKNTELCGLTLNLYASFENVNIVFPPAEAHLTFECSRV